LVRYVVGGESFDFGPEGPDAEWQVGPGESAEFLDGRQWIVIGDR
jgi:hypothetical protein